MGDAIEPRSVVLSRHKTRFNARRKAKALRQSAALRQPDLSRAAWGRYVQEAHDLVIPVPTWADEFKVERAKRTPFAWVVRAYEKPILI